MDDCFNPMSVEDLEAIVSEARKAIKEMFQEVKLGNEPISSLKDVYPITMQIRELNNRIEYLKKNNKKI